MKITKKNLTDYIYLLINMSYELKNSYGKTLKIIDSILRGTDVEVNKDFNQLSQLVIANKDLLSEQDRKIIASIINNYYLMMGYLDKKNNRDLEYREREENKNNEVLKNVTLKVLFAYISEGTNLKGDLKSFTEDFESYLSNHEVIYELLESDADNEVMNASMDQRKVEADNLINKYSSLDISDIDLRSVLEDDILFAKNFISISDMTEEEIAMFETKTA